MANIKLKQAKALVDALSGAIHMSDIKDIAEALIEVATIPNERAMRSIVRALGFRLFQMEEVRKNMIVTLEEAIRAPGAEEGEKEAT